MAPKIKSLEKRFWEKVDKKISTTFYNNTRCWEWIASKSEWGYGQIGTHSNKTSTSNRVSWLLHFGEIPSGMLVCHKCDNPSCVNPEHLFLGTVVDNNKDRHSKGRTKTPPNKGENNPFAILNKEKVIEIKKYLSDKSLSIKEISIKYGVAVNTVYGIRQGRNWKNV